MQKLLKGYVNFRNNVLPQKYAHYDQLAQGQNPEILLITCCDSRVLPHEFTGTEEGDLFEERSLGNIVPEFGNGQTQVSAIVEFAVLKLNIKHIVVCGHSDCGAMKGLINPESLADVPHVAEWVGYAQEALDRVRARHPHLEGPELLDAVVHENVLVQVNRLRQFPFVQKRLASAELFLHGWVFEIQNGRVVAYDPRVGEYVPLDEAYKPTTV